MTWTHRCHLEEARPPLPWDQAKVIFSTQLSNQKYLSYEFWTACRLPAMAVSMFIVTKGFDVQIPYVPPAAQRHIII